MSDPKKDLMVDCIVIGGAADGVLLQIRYGATRVMLGRETHAKPVVSPLAEVEMAKVSDIYDVFYMDLPTVGKKSKMFAWAIIEGQSPMWAARQLSVAYVKYSTQRLITDAKNATKQ